MATTTNFGWETPDDTDLVKDGAAAIRTALGGVDTSFVDLKGGTTGQVLAKASGTDLDYTWTTPGTVADSYGYSAGKNKVINGDFSVWQRGTTFTNPAGDSYTADRFMIDYGTAAPTSNSVTRQAFTPGAAPVAGYEGAYFLRSTLTTIGTTSRLSFHHKIENVQTYAGQTVTLSFWAKADSARSLAGFVQQNFGSGGSGTVSTGITSQSITTSWTRFSMQVSVPSISGKTIGTSSFLNIRLDQAVAAGSVLELWGLQLEYGSTLTAFQTATGNPQAELAACQRYYYRSIAGALYQVLGSGYGGSSTNTYIGTPLPVQMRVAPTAVEFANLAINFGGSYYAISAGALSTDTSTANLGWVNWTNASGTTGGSPYVLRSNASASGYVGFSAEL